MFAYLRGGLIIIIIIIPLFITFGDRNYGSITIKIQNTTYYIQLFRERLSGKLHATILKGIVGGFEFSFFPKEFDRIGPKGQGNVFANAKGKQQK